MNTNRTTNNAPPAGLKVKTRIKAGPGTCGGTSCGSY